MKTIVSALISLSVLAGMAAPSSAIDPKTFWKQERDPKSVIQAMMEALRRANLDAAMAIFADEAVIVNATGRKTTDRNELKWLVNAEIWLRDDFKLDQLHVDGKRVTWVEAASAPFYKNIGVAPVQFAFEAIVQGGQITSIVAHLPTHEIARIREACNARTPEPLLRDRPCSEFVKLIEAHTLRLRS